LHWSICRRRHSSHLGLWSASTALNSRMTTPGTALSATSTLFGLSSRLERFDASFAVLSRVLVSDTFCLQEELCTYQNICASSRRSLSPKHFTRGGMRIRRGCGNEMSRKNPGLGLLWGGATAKFARGGSGVTGRTSGFMKS
jgi:hypothetical protein